MRSEYWIAELNYRMTIPERTTVRHQWALIIEGTDAAFDRVRLPYSNWGYENRLDYVLSRWKEVILSH